MFLEYMNKGIQLVRTSTGKREVKQGEKFLVSDKKGNELMRLYKGMFKKVESKGNTVEESEKKEVKKDTPKKSKVK